jgi:hypothetical protein
MSVDVELFKSFFRESTSYYLVVLEKHRSGKRFSFNVYAYLLGFLWLTYRKLYLGQSFYW